jgi:hypothetical protein
LARDERALKAASGNALPKGESCFPGSIILVLRSITEFGKRSLIETSQEECECSDNPIVGCGQVAQASCYLDAIITRAAELFGRVAGMARTRLAAEATG